MFSIFWSFILKKISLCFKWPGVNWHTFKGDSQSHHYVSWKEFNSIHTSVDVRMKIETAFLNVQTEGNEKSRAVCEGWDAAKVASHPVPWVSVSNRMLSRLRKTDHLKITKPLTPVASMCLWGVKTLYCGLGRQLVSVGQVSMRFSPLYPHKKTGELFMIAVLGRQREEPPGAYQPVSLGELSP